MSALTDGEKLALDKAHQRKLTEAKLDLSGLTMEEATQAREAAFAKANLQWDSEAEFFDSQSGDVKQKQAAEYADYQAMHKRPDSIFLGT
jgi:hypothetical protein